MNSESKEYAQTHDANLTGKPAGNTSSSSSRASEKIFKDIYQVLGEESGIDLDVNGGVVTVCGMVDTQETMPWVIDRIRSVKGVTDVINEMKVKPFNQ